MRARNFLANISVLALLWPLTSNAGTTVADIQLSIQDFMHQYQEVLQQRYPNASRVSHKINTLDSRLIMADCDEDITVVRRDNSEIGRINLKVSCNAPTRWSIYVPTDIQVFHPVVVSGSPISKNTLLRDHHLSMRDMDIGRIRGSYYFHLSDVIDMESRRQLTPGTVITSSHLRLPMVISKGDSVVLSAVLGSLSVKAPATALTDGRQGQQIRVQNKQSKRIVDARVTGPGAVRATL